jgi:hypothetical protein
MKFLSYTLLGIIFCLSSAFGYSQITSIPEQAKENFERQYPHAEHVKWENDIINVNVKFELDGEKMNAEYNNQGIWRSTLKEWSFDKLPEEVKEGLKKSKYAEREVKEVKVIYYPGDVIRYRLKVEKNNIEKKFLYFTTNGRLIRETITI